MTLGQVTISKLQIIALAITLGVVVAVYLFSLAQKGRAKSQLTYLTIALAAGGLVYWVGTLSPALDRAVNVLKACLALTAASCVFYEVARAQQKRPVAERWKRFVGITLGIASIVLYFNGFKVGYAKFWHRHDQYHYYFGAKYFRELGYDRLYKCTVVALDETGKVTDTYNGKPFTLDMSAEVRSKDKKIRNLGGDNLLMPAAVALEHPEECKSHFSPARWEQFRKDIRTFRWATIDGKDYWDGMQKDHGYNPPPVWTLTGYLITSVHDASEGFMQALGLIDEVYLLGMFVGLYWAFGWRVFSVAAILWGCQATAPNYWTLGAFLRQDWLFWFVMASCFARKRYFGSAGASMVYAALLRVFPGLAVLGWLVVAGAYLYRHKRMRPEHLRALAGGTAAAVVLVGASLLVVGKDSYQQFYKHTIEVHDQTPLTNHVGLRVMFGHRLECIVPGLSSCEGHCKASTTKEDCDTCCAGESSWGSKFDDQTKKCICPVSGRMRDTQDNSALDPFEKWKAMRLDAWRRHKPLGYALIALTAIAFIAVVRRVRSLWVAQALGQVWIILLSQLTSYYYSFVIIAAPLTRVRRDLEVWMFGFAAVTQFVWLGFGFNDDRYDVLTWVTLGFCYVLLYFFAPKSWAWWKKAAAEVDAAPVEGPRE